MTDGELLQRIAQILRQEIGPAVEGEYPRTQAFMAAVVLEKLGRQVTSAGEHAAAESEDLTTLLGDLRRLLTNGSAPTGVLRAVDGLEQARNNAALCRLIEALYAARPELGDSQFAILLGRIRTTLRRSIDRRVAVAG